MVVTHNNDIVYTTKTFISAMALDVLVVMVGSHLGCLTPCCGQLFDFCEERGRVVDGGAAQQHAHARVGQIHLRHVACLFIPVKDRLRLTQRERERERERERGIHEYPSITIHKYP